MDALSHVAEAASKALFGSTDSSSQHESGEEPISGKLGNVAAGEPYDAGNMGGAQALSNSLCTHHKVHVQITHYVRRVPLREIPREMTVRTRLTLTTGCAGDVDEEPSEVDIETTVEDENGRRVDEDAKQNRTVTTTSTSKVITAGDMRPMPAPKPELAQEDVKTTEKGERMGEDLMDIPTALPPMVLEPERTRALGKDANTASAVPSVSATARKEYEEGKKNKKDIEEEDEGIKMEDLEDPQPEENVLKDDPVDTPTDKETPNPDPQPRLDPSTNPYLYLSPVSTKEKAPEDATTRGSPKGTTNPASTSTFNTGASGEPHLRGSTDFNPLKLTMTPDTTSPTTEKDFHSHTTTSNPFNVLGEQAAKDPFLQF
ncbi:uncharacterized protein CTHT_0022840 [Thermochaetoides thermophila DSM 1495]|uniref:Uncharacterized protein n=1 Tax=Chaetomium thermophilum (strain DSM 1495 / CBS 144.50 / IMI 039719) TaxID=759272 RepID=G0S4H4_CHATD|nr:hypothetical protein CTHT_0022840 [Thermochaetoides thermophila DSM 1495]EGS20452.1 hypothetical protein CTHT_0022840 [Thermochaetoides thermophila DSM 1495]